MDILTVLVYLLSLVCYSLFTICLTKRALKLRKNRRFVACLILVGAIVNGLGIALKELNMPSGGLICIGFLVFLFGFVLLLYGNFKEYQ